MTKVQLMAGAVALGLAVLAGPALADYGTGKAYYDSGRYVEAVGQFLPAAEQGNSLAQYMMGRMHQEGRGTDRDFAQAYMWYRLSADRGYTPAAGARDALLPAMSASERARAEQMAVAWTYAHPTGRLAAPVQPAPKDYYQQASYSEPYSVRAIQRTLTELGYQAGPVDGVMGARTRAAIRTFQINSGLPVSGEPSRALYDSLLDARAERFVPQTVAQMQPQPVPQVAPAYDTQLVIGLQGELRQRGYDIPAVSGRFDTATATAIRNYQTAAGLPATGVPSSALLSQIRSSVAVTPVSAAYRDQLRTVQTLLSQRGYDAGPADGVMGPKARNAIRTYQSDAGLPVSGEINSILMASLQSSEPTPTPYGGEFDFVARSTWTPQQEAMPQGDAALGAAIENELELLGYDVDKTNDGDLKYDSRQAIRQYQDDVGVKESGKASSELLQSLRQSRYQAIEQHLGDKGYRVGPIDGVIDWRTSGAIRTFERDSGLPETGIPAAQLLKHLNTTTVRAHG